MITRKQRGSASALAPFMQDAGGKGPLDRRRHSEARGKDSRFGVEQASGFRVSDLQQEVAPQKLQMPLMFDGKQWPVAANDFEMDNRHAGFHHAQFDSRRMRDIQDSPADIGTPVIDPHVDMPSVDKVDHPHEAAKGQLPMSCGQSRHIEYFSVGRQSAMKVFSIPGCDTTVLDAEIERKVPFGDGGASNRNQAADQAKHAPQPAVVSRSLLHLPPLLRMDRLGSEQVP